MVIGYTLSQNVMLHDVSCDVNFWRENKNSANWPLGYKTFSMLNSVEYEILNAHKYKDINKIGFLGSDKPRMLFFPLINVKMPTIVGILTFMSRKSIITSRLGVQSTVRESLAKQLIKYF